MLGIVPNVPKELEGEAISIYNLLQARYSIKLETMSTGSILKADMNIIGDFN